MGSDRPLLTSLIVSPRWWKVSTMRALDHGFFDPSKGNTPVSTAEFEEARHIQACSGAGSSLISDSQ